MASASPNTLNATENLKKKKVLLQHINDDMKHYSDQIADLAQEYKGQLKTHFEVLKVAFNQLIDDRLASLEGQVDSVEKSSLEKVKACQKIVEEGINKVDLKLQQAETLQENGTADGPTVEEGQSDAKISLHNLVSSQQLSNIFLLLPSEMQTLNQLRGVVSSHGDVSTQSFPIVTDLVPKMSSVSVKWGSTSTDGSTPVVYSLEMSEVGRRGESLDYSEVYRGSLMFFIAARLKPNQEYSFRVSGQSAGSLPLWSVPATVSTLNPKFGWRAGDCGCALSNGGATLSTASGASSVYVSSGRSYVCGNSLTLTVEASPRDVHAGEDGFGLSLMEANEIRPLEKGTLFLTCKGVVCVGSQKMTTRLPAIKPGSAIIFYSEALPNNKVRVTIEVEEKVVTFDWSHQSDDPNGGLHFFARLSAPGWVVTVE